MATFHDLTTSQLKQAIQIRETIESLQAKLDSILGGTTEPKQRIARPGKRTMSAAGRAKIAAAQKARWAKVKEKPLPGKAPAKPVAKKKSFSPERRAKLAAAMKARWAAKKKAAGE